MRLRRPRCHPVETAGREPGSLRLLARDVIAAGTATYGIGAHVSRETCDARSHQTSEGVERTAPIRATGHSVFSPLSPSGRPGLVGSHATFRLRSRIARRQRQEASSIARASPETSRGREEQGGPDHQMFHVKRRSVGSPWVQAGWLRPGGVTETSTRGPSVRIAEPADVGGGAERDPADDRRTVDPTPAAHGDDAHSKRERTATNPPLGLWPC
jgi:hypothetical protein